MRSILDGCCLSSSILKKTAMQNLTPLSTWNVASLKSVSVRNAPKSLAKIFPPIMELRLLQCHKVVNKDTILMTFTATILKLFSSTFATGKCSAYDQVLTISGRDYVP